MHKASLASETHLPLPREFWDWRFAPSCPSLFLTLETCYCIFLIDCAHGVHTHVQWGFEWGDGSRVSVFFLSCGFQGWNSGHQTYWWVLYLLSHLTGPTVSFQICPLPLQVKIKFKKQNRNRKSILWKLQCGRWVSWFPSSLFIFPCKCPLPRSSVWLESYGFCYTVHNFY